MLNYVNRVHVGLASGADNGVTTLAGLGRGDILVLDSEMTPIVAAPSDNAGPRKSFYVALGTGFPASPFILSAPIFGDQVTSANSKATRAAADQVTTVTVPVPAIGDVAEVVIAFKDRLRLIANRQSRLVLTAEAASIDVYDLASALAGQAQYSAPYSDPYGIRVDVTATGTTYGATDNNATVTQGSKIVTFATAAAHSAGTDIIVGDILAFDDIDYKVVDVNALVLTLDRAFQAASEAAFPLADIDVKHTITAASLTVTGTDSPYNNPEIDVYEKPVFEVGSSQVGAVVADVTDADLGQGIDKQVKKMESDAQGYLGNSNRIQWPIPTFDYHTVDGTAYNVYQFTSYDEHEGDLQNMMKSPVGLTIAFSNTSAAQENDISAILDPLIPGFSI